MDMASHPLPPYTDPAAKQRARWEELAVHAAEANAFYAPDMLAAAIDHLAADRDVRLIEAHDASGLSACCPLRYDHAMGDCRSAALPTGFTTIVFSARR